jgi:4-hydroxyphenylpyruvate dioxygenase-like putative hemolysin
MTQSNELTHVLANGRTVKSKERTNTYELPTSAAEQFVRLDHIAVAVRDLASAERWFTRTLGFRCVERRSVEGRKSGMVSAVMELGGVVVVLVQGTHPNSQVNRFVDNYGQGVQHVAFQVRDLDSVVNRLRAQDLDFSTGVVEKPGLRQAFSRRNAETGLMLEFIERGQFEGFNDDNVQSLFLSMEANDDY